MNQEQPKLELRHLCPYLPYELKICYRILDLENGNPNTDNPDDRMKDCIMTMDCSRLHYGTLPETDRWYKEGDRFKPLLIPLSELIDDLLKDKRISKKQELYVKTAIIKGDLEFLPYFVVEKIFELNGDYFGLISKGLALNKLTYE